jgi:hypothetical protein
VINNQNRELRLPHLTGDAEFKAAQAAVSAAEASMHEAERRHAAALTPAEDRATLPRLKLRGQHWMKPASGATKSRAANHSNFAKRSAPSNTVTCAICLKNSKALRVRSAVSRQSRRGSPRRGTRSAPTFWA